MTADNAAGGVPAATHAAGGASAATHAASDGSAAPHAKERGAAPAPIQVPTLAALPHVRHGFFTREGGVSEGLFETLNCGRGSDDEPERVTENRGRVAQHLGLSEARLLSVYQIHSPTAVFVTGPWAPADAPQADAMVSASTGLGLGILTADCVPVLFADRNRPFVAAAHAGWKGAIGGVLEATIAKLETMGAERADLIAAIGPAIRQPAYEVGPEFVARFEADDADNARWFRHSPREDHALFDLTGFVAEKLRRAGVGEVYDTGLCTFADEARFFSYRRTTHRAEADYGRQISVIALSDA